MRAAVFHKGPTYIRLGADGPNVTNADVEFRIGKASILRKGVDLTMIATGSMVAPTLLAADRLIDEKISAQVIDMHTIKPVDRDCIIRAAKETGAIVTVEEHSIIGGLGSAVAEVLTESIPVPIERIGINDTFGESAPYRELIAKHRLTSRYLCEVARRVMKRKR